MAIQDWATQPEPAVPGLQELRAGNEYALWLDHETMTIPTEFVTRLLRAWDSMTLIIELAASTHEPEEDDPETVK